MIYLVKLDNTYKIGKSKDPHQRIKTLSATHLVCELIAIREGECREEKMIHEACKKYRIKNELFEPKDAVVDIFNAFIFDSLAEENKKLKEELEKEKRKYQDIVNILNRCMSTIDRYRDIIEEREGQTERLYCLCEELIKVKDIKV